MSPEDQTVQLKKSLAIYAFIIFDLFIVGLTLAVVTKLSRTGVVIGWGLTLGVPLLLGFYAGLFAFIGSVEPGDPAFPKKRMTIKRLFKFFGLLILGVSILTIGYFTLDTFLKGNTTAEALFNGALSGLYCISMALLVFIIPLIAGIFLSLFIGKFIRRALLQKQKRKFHQLMSAVLLSLALPSLLDAIEVRWGFRDQLQTESVLTTMEIPATVQQVWDHLQFYEDTGSEATLLFALGFPKPLWTEGDIKRVGNQTKCVYDKGYLVKKITAVSSSQQSGYLAFDVIEQFNIEDRAIKLKDGSFRLSQMNSDLMQIQLKTNYDPLMTPRWIWRPLEEMTARALHQHVVDKISEEISTRKMKLVENTLKE